MREICLDTETTGLKPEEGHRIIEIGAVELIDKMPTGREYHVYINPEREVPPDAVRMHGITSEFLADKPVFADIAEEFLAFIDNAKLVIHNAEFDRRFLNAELTRLNLPLIPRERCVDTLVLAREKFPGASCSLDALCKRFGIDNSHRTLHGAIIDARILAQVYLELAGGRQHALGLMDMLLGNSDGPGSTAVQYGPRPQPLAPRLTDQARRAHAEFIASLGGTPLWQGWLRQAAEEKD